MPPYLIQKSQTNIGAVGDNIICETFAGEPLVKTQRISASIIDSVSTHTKYWVLVNPTIRGPYVPILVFVRCPGRRYANRDIKFHNR